MKLPSAPAGGTLPSGNSLAATNPGAFGSRVAGVGRWAATIAGVTPATKLNEKDTLESFVFIESGKQWVVRFSVYVGVAGSILASRYDTHPDGRLPVTSRS